MKSANTCSWNAVAERTMTCSEPFARTTVFKYYQALNFRILENSLGMNNAVLTCILLVDVLVASLGVPLFAQPAVIDRIVAVVGKEPILLSDLEAQTEFYAFNNHVESSTPG